MFVLKVFTRSIIIITLSFQKIRQELNIEENWNKVFLHVKLERTVMEDLVPGQWRECQPARKCTQDIKDTFGFGSA